MPRKATAISTAQSDSTTPTTARKRARDDPPHISSSARNRNLRPNRTPNKSRYFESDASGEDVSEDESAQSGYKEEGRDSSTSSQGSEDDAVNVSASERTPPPRKRVKRQVRPSKVASNTSNKQDLWRPGVKAGLGPGTQVVIDKPRARSPGDTPYHDDRIHPNTMLFLRDLAQHNDREWLKMHDPDYRTSWKDWTDFLECLAPKVSESDETIPELPLKDCVFRIYRDIRFSPDPTPYKPYFSAAWSRTGRKGPYAAYYIQIKPGRGSFLGGGLWMPEAQSLAKLRRDIDRRPHRIKQVLLNPSIRRNFLNGVGADDKKAVKAFTTHNADTALKTKPRDYDANHRDVDLLRLRNFTIGCKLDDEDIVGSEVLDTLAGLVQSLVPFITYLNSVVMPDQEEEESDDEGENESS